MSLSLKELAKIIFISTLVYTIIGLLHELGHIIYATYVLDSTVRVIISADSMFPYSLYSAIHIYTDRVDTFIFISGTLSVAVLYLMYIFIEDEIVRTAVKLYIPAELTYCVYEFITYGLKLFKFSTLTAASLYVFVLIGGGLYVLLQSERGK